MTPASNPLLDYGDALGREWKEKDFFFCHLQLTSLFTWTALHLKEIYNDAFFISHHLVPGWHTVWASETGATNAREKTGHNMGGGAVKWELSLAESKMGETWSDEALLY